MRCCRVKKVKVKVKDLECVFCVGAFGLKRPASSEAIHLWLTGLITDSLRFIGAELLTFCFGFV